LNILKFEDFALKLESQPLTRDGTS